MKYLVDTDWVINHFNNIERITQKLEELAPEGIAISIISVAELYEGIYFSKDPISSQEQLEEFLAPDLTILSIDKEICKIFGRERGKLRQEQKQKKKKIEDVANFDLLIASTALCHNLTLLTNNKKHFEKIEGLKIISI